MTVKILFKQQGKVVLHDGIQFDNCHICTIRHNKWRTKYDITNVHISMQDIIGKMKHYYWKNARTLKAELIKVLNQAEINVDDSFLHKTSDLFVATDGGRQEWLDESNRDNKKSCAGPTIGDCAVRGMANFLGNEHYGEIWNWFDQRQKSSPDTGVLNKLIDKFAIKNGMTKIYCRKRGLTISKAAKLGLSGVAATNDHIVYISDGNLYDTWDSSRRYLAGFYVSQEEKDRAITILKEHDVYRGFADSTQTMIYL